MKKTALLALMATLELAGSAIAACPTGWSTASDLQDTDWLVVDGSSCPTGFHSVTTDDNGSILQPSDTSVLTDSMGTYSVGVSTACTAGN